MKCPKCNKDWPAGVKFCGNCGGKLDSAQGAGAISEGAVVEKVRSLLPMIGVGKFLEPNPGMFVTQKGSTHVTVRVIDVGMGRLAIRSTSPVTVNTPITQELLDFLLKENTTLIFGGFGLGPKNEIVFSHSIMASSVDVVELGVSVSAVVNMADKYDDQIVQRWGGKTARQLAMDAFVLPALLKAAVARGGARAAATSHAAASTGVRHESPDASAAIKVGSVAEEYAYLARQRCQCGGGFQIQAQALLEINGLYHDRLDISCTQCGAAKRLLFDINSFFRKGLRR